MSEDTPWWYSAADQEPHGESGSESGGESGGGGPDGRSVDLWALLGSLQRLATWAQQVTADQVLAPHAEHVDPTAHPTCVMCRTMTVLADVRGFAGAGAGAGAGTGTGAGRSGGPGQRTGGTAGRGGSAVAAETGIRWLDLHRGPCKR